jgi:hypothetical protein
MNSRYAMSHLCLALLIAAVSSTTLAQAPAGVAGTLASGQAVGTFTAKGRTVKLAYAAAFVEQDEKGKPVMLLLTEQPVPAEKWKSRTDIMRYRMDKNPLVGVGFRLDDKREEIGADYYTGDFPTSTSGVFVLKLDGAPGKSLVGTAKSTETAGKLSEPVSLDVRFNATLK